jgi:hypothetical protein
MKNTLIVGELFMATAAEVISDCITYPAVGIHNEIGRSNLLVRI